MALDNPLLEVHRAAGATLGNWFGCALPSRFSSIEAEYRAARETVVLADTNFRAFFRFTGPDRVRYLNAILTSNVRDLQPGQGEIGLLLNPQGHILAEIETLAMEDSLLAISHALVREATAATLEKFIIMDDVTLLNETQTTGSVAIGGPRAAVCVRDLCGVELASLPNRSHVAASIGAIPCRIIWRIRPDGTLAEIFAAREQLPEIWRRLREAMGKFSGMPIGFEAINSLRLEAGIPWFGYDFDSSVIPHEAGLENTHISYTKGCYTGQEIVERVRSRGQVNRRRAGLRFAGVSDLAAGSKLLAGGAEVGHVTSSGYSFALGVLIGMGYLRREHTTPGRQLQCLTGTAEVIELPLAQI